MSGGGPLSPPSLPLSSPTRSPPLPPSPSLPILIRMHNNEETQSVSHSLDTLPSFSSDHSDLILNSVIERTAQSNELFLTVIFASVAMFDPNEVRQYKIERIETTKIEQWKSFLKHQKSLLYLSNGRRSPIVKYTCKFYSPDHEIKLEGTFLPNRQTSDSNSNRRFDVFRCPIPQQLLTDHSYSTENLSVLIEREDTRLIHFALPVQTRSTGYLLSSPPSASQFDAWKTPSPTEFHICTSRTVNRFPSLDHLMIYRSMEFIQHHLLLGGTHIFLSVPYSWESASMKNILKSFQYFIQKKQLTIMSEVGDDINMWRSTLGIQWNQLAVRNLQINSCLYLSKGMTDYLGVWDLHEFFLPRPPHQSILDVIRSVTLPSGVKFNPSDSVFSQNLSSWKGGVGLADGDGHPFCYLALEGYTSLASYSIVAGNLRQHWIRDAYGASQLKEEPLAKSILPTHVIHQGGLHVSGGCRLDPVWTTCGAKSMTASDYCYNDVPDYMYLSDQLHSKGKVHSIPSTHNIDDIVHQRDTKKLNLNSDAYLISFQYSNSLEKGGDQSLRSSANPYLKHYSAKVIEELSKIGLSEKTLRVVPEGLQPNITNPDGTSSWKKYEEVFPPLPQAQTASVLQSENPLAYDPDDFFHGNSNGYYNFTENFADPKILINRQPDTLPAFATDFSDIALGAVIEREHESWNLFVTTFFLQHWMLWKPPKDYGFNKIHHSQRRNWEEASRKFNETSYLRSGARDIQNDQYRCRLTVNSDTAPYIVPGVFLPNALSSDRNANRRLDVFRCQIRDSMKLYHVMSRSNESLFVEILRSDTVIVQYYIPWKTRRVGYSLSAPSVADSFDAWLGSNLNQPTQIKPGTYGTEMLHMCVAGVESPLSQQAISRYLEFIQHHLLLGVQHMFISTAYAWNGQNMANFLTVLQSFLQDKLVSVSSLAGDNIDQLYTLLGTSLDRDNSKVFAVNMCLYVSKGVADYVAVWDTDEFFIPRPPHHTIIDIIRKAESSTELAPIAYEDNELEKLSQTWKGGRGWADGDLHPFCYLQLTSEVIVKHPNETEDNSFWIGSSFSSPPDPDFLKSLGFKKSIFPTRTIYQAGLHVGGACHLGINWTTCSDPSQFCYSHTNKDVRGVSLVMKKKGMLLLNISSSHNFDTIVSDKDAKRIDSRDAVIYHIQLYRPELTTSPSSSNQSGIIKSSPFNDYTTRFFPRVLKALKRRKLHVIEFIEDVEIHVPTADDYWLNLHEMTQKFVDSPLRPDGSNDLNNLPEPPPSFYGDINSLPHFMSDGTNIILGAVLERAHDSWDLHVTTFFMANEQLANYTGKIINSAIRQESVKPWMKAIKHARKIRNTEYGVRNDGLKYYCVIQNDNSSSSYRVKAVFLPNELTPDVNANKRLDILRCRLSDSQRAYYKLSRTNQNCSVEIFRENESIVRYHIPWKTRRVGYMLTTPEETSRLDPWKGWQNTSEVEKKETKSPLPGEVGGDTIHMCVPGIESPISKTTLAMYSEFLEHHLAIGVEHFHFATTYLWTSRNMDLFLGSFGSYIDDGLISVTTTAADADLVYGLYGMSMHRDNVKIFYVNMCLYYTKGLAEYIAVWDIDEYFIPQLPHLTISDVIRSMDIRPTARLSPVISESATSEEIFQLAANWTSSKGWADLEGHPLCYFMMSSVVLYRPVSSYPVSSLSNRWIGTRFLQGPEKQSGLGFKKPIIPTRKIFQGALHMVGGCQLYPPFTGCNERNQEMSSVSNESAILETGNEFCYSSTPRHRYGWTVQFTPDGLPIKRIDFSTQQRFDGLIMDKDAKKVNAKLDAVIYHIQIHRSYFTSSAPINSTNDYVTRYFPSVLKKLQRRGLELLTTTPKLFKIPEKQRDEGNSWESFREMYWNISSTK